MLTLEVVCSAQRKRAFIGISAQEESAWSRDSDAGVRCVGGGGKAKGGETERQKARAEALRVGARPHTPAEYLAKKSATCCFWLSLP